MLAASLPPGAALMLYLRIPIPSACAPAPVEKADPLVRRVRRPRRRLSREVVTAAVALILALYAALAWTGTLSKGVSFDEGLQLAVGYNLWVHDDYRIEGANGDLVKRWATLPFLLSQPKFVGTDDPDWRSAAAYDLGRRFLFESGNPAEWLLAQARAMAVLLGVATGLLVFWRSRMLFGPVGGLVSLAVFALSPEMLAFGGIVSTDMSITLTLFASTFSVWGLLHVISVTRLAASLACVGLLVLAKPTALVLLPITLAMLVVRGWVGKPLVLQWRSRRWEVRTWRRQAIAIGLAASLHVVAGWAALWAHYGFRYAASSRPDDPSVGFHQPFGRDDVPRVYTHVLEFCQQTRLLPEGFCRGIDALLGCDDRLGSFKNGQWRIGGWPSFFPYAIWVKTPPATWLLVAAGVIAWWRLARKRAADSALPLRRSRQGNAPRIYAATPLVVLVVVYLLVAMTEDLNLGHRHVLPIYPAFYVLAGAVALAWRSYPRAGKAATIAAVAWLGSSTADIAPNYLAYFAPQAGGPRLGYTRLVDSSLDWGMSLPALKRWLDDHNPGGGVPVFLAYFGSDSPRHQGIRSTRLPGFFERRTFQRYTVTPGYYAISASLLQGAYTAAFGPWTRHYEQLYQQKLAEARTFDDVASDPVRLQQLLQAAPLEAWMEDFDLFDNLRFARLCAWLRHQGEPPAHVEHAIFIWKLNQADLEAALLGPPVELAAEPAVIRRYRRFVARQP